MCKHTKGPWEVGGPYPSVSVIVMVDEGYGGPDGGAEPPRYEAIAILDGRTEGEQNIEALANARLMAAAPELLDALRGFMEYFEADYDQPKEYHRGITAIEKAEGANV